MKQSKLPKHLEAHSISELKDGEVSYIVPWSILADSKGYLWINGDLPIRSDGQVKITRSGEGFQVKESDLAGEEYEKYDPNPYWKLMPIELI